MHHQEPDVRPILQYMSLMAVSITQFKKKYGFNQLIWGGTQLFIHFHVYVWYSCGLKDEELGETLQQCHVLRSHLQELEQDIHVFRGWSFHNKGEQTLIINFDGSEQRTKRFMEYNNTAPRLGYRQLPLNYDTDSSRYSGCEHEQFRML